MEQYFYDDKLTSAIIDRIIHHSHLIVFDGPSDRLVNSLMKKTVNRELCNAFDEE